MENILFASVYLKCLLFALLFSSVFSDPVVCLCVYWNGSNGHVNFAQFVFNSSIYFLIPNEIQIVSVFPFEETTILVCLPSSDLLKHLLKAH